eukprot:403375189
MSYLGLHHTQAPMQQHVQSVQPVPQHKHNHTSKIGRFVRTCDLFAQPIYITYKKDSYYRTIVGGVCAIIVGIFVLWYSIEQIVSLARGDYTLQSTQTYIDDGDQLIYDIDTSKFNIAVEIGGFGEYQNMNFSRYVIPQFAFVTYDANTGNNNYEFVDSIPCSQDIFQWSSKGQSISKFTCPNIKNIEIYGQETSQQSREFMFILQECGKISQNPTVDCEPQDQFKKAISNLYVDIALQSKLFDPENYESSKSLQNQITYFRQYIVSGSYFVKEYRLEKNFVDLEDSMFSIMLQGSSINNEKYQFYVMNFFQNQLFDPLVSRFEKLGVINFKFTQSQTKVTLTLTTSSITGLISSIGGFFSLINMLVGYSLYKFQCFRYEASLMKRLFQQDKEEGERIDSQNPDDKDGIDPYDVHDVNDPLRKTREMFSSKKLSMRRFVNSIYDTKNHIVSQIQATKKYYISIWHWYQFYFQCCLCCCKQRKTKLKVLNERYLRAKEKLYYDIDILENIKVIRNARFLIQTHLKKYQRQLIKNFKVYNVDNKSIGKKRPYNLQRLIEKIDLKKELDRKLTYKITEDEEEIHLTPSITQPRFRHSTYAHLI